MRRIQPHGNQQRAHLALEILPHPALLHQVTLAVRDHLDAVDRQTGQKLVVVQGVLAIHQIVGGHRYPLERVRAEAGVGFRPLRSSQMGLSPHFKEFVQVGRHDAQVAQPLQHRHVLAVGPVQHPLVEGEDAVVTVQQCDVAAQAGAGVRLVVDMGHGVEMLCDSLMMDCCCIQ